MDLLKLFRDSNHSSLTCIFASLTRELNDEDIQKLTECSDVAGKVMTSLDDPVHKDTLLKEMQWTEDDLANMVDWVIPVYHVHLNVFKLAIPKENIPLVEQLPFVEHVYQIPSRFQSNFTNNYIYIVKGLNQCVGQAKTDTISKPDVVNMSLQNLDPHPFDPYDPVNVGTRLLYEHGVVVVIAAGNRGPKKNSLTGWAVCPWVIGVGAADKEGTRVWECSSRGQPGDSLNRPTIVAPGIDMIGPWPRHLSKSSKQIENDRRKITPETIEKQKGIKIPVTEELLTGYTVSSGTSQATSMVTQLVALIIELRRKLNLPSSPDIIKQVLIEMAVPIPGKPEHEIGHGFVSIYTIRDYFDALDTGHKVSSLWEGHKQLREIWDDCRGAGVTMMYLDTGYEEPHLAHLHLI